MITNPQFPKFIVFDLDFTLWDCGGTWCDCLTPPFHLSDRSLVDSRERQITLYPDVIEIMRWCDAQSIPMGIASRTEQPNWARKLLRLLGIEHRFAYSEIYPSSKLRHFSSLTESSTVSYEEMLFFDDEMRNIREVGTLGVKTVFVDSGVHWASFKQGLELFNDKNTS